MRHLLNGIERVNVCLITGAMYVVAQSMVAFVAVNKKYIYIAQIARCTLSAVMHINGNVARRDNLSTTENAYSVSCPRATATSLLSRHIILNGQFVRYNKNASPFLQCTYHRTTMYECTAAAIITEQVIKYIYWAQRISYVRRTKVKKTETERK